MIRPFYQSPLHGEVPYAVSVRHQQPAFQSHWHGEIEILYVINGSIKVNVNKRVFNINQRTAIIIGSTELHSIEEASHDIVLLVIEMGYPLLGAGFKRFTEVTFDEKVMNFDNECLANHKKHKQLEEIFINLASEKCVVLNLFNEINDNEIIKSRFRVCADLFLIASLLLDCAEYSDASAKHLNYVNSMLSINQVLDYVQSHYNEPISLCDAAKLAGYEETRFCQLFKKAVDISFHKYLNNKRIDVAKKLLCESDLSIGTIAKNVGISEAKTFCRLFKEFCGVTPTKFRDERIEKNK